MGQEFGTQPGATHFDELVAALSPKQQDRIRQAAERSKERIARGGRVRRSYGAASKP